MNFKYYKKQRNICVNLLRKNKTQYFNGIYFKNTKDGKKYLENY